MNSVQEARLATGAAPARTTVPALVASAALPMEMTVAAAAG